jgi:uncharacterized protein (DUF302 family)
MKKLLLTLFLLSAAGSVGASPVAASKAGTMQTALDDLSVALANHGYQLVKVQPLDHALVKRGFQDPGVRLVFVGKEELVQQALVADPALLTLLPLRLTMAREGDIVTIRSDDLAPWRSKLPAEADTLQAWQDGLSEVLEDYSRQ